MASPHYKIHENTAAEFIHYQSYNKPLGNGATEQCWTRYSTANEEWNIAAAGGQRFLINFDKNFSKKHLATFSKKEWATEKEKWLQSQQPGQRTDEENWNRAQKQLLDNKILKILGVRNPRCVCGHYQKSLDPAPAAVAVNGHSNNGNCKHAGCGCAGFAAAPSTYVASRTAKAKPDVNPLVGASTNQSSCIVLNWIPKNEFEAAVAASILAVDPTNVLPDSAPVPYTHATPFIHLTWSFPTHPGAVRHAQNGTVDVDTGTWVQLGCYKTTVGLPMGITAKWIVAHWNGQG